MSDGKISLDRDVLKVLASDTRIEILKLLDQRKHTVTELARALTLNKATCHEHLEKLCQVELVQRLEDDRKWVYYQLSWKGRRLLHPEKMAIALLLSTAFGAALAASAALWFWMASNVQEVLGDAPPEAEPSARAFAEDAAAPAAEAARDMTFLWIAIAAGILVIALSIAAFVVWRRGKARLARPIQTA